MIEHIPSEIRSNFYMEYIRDKVKHLNHFWTCGRSNEISDYVLTNGVKK